MIGKTAKKLKSLRRRLREVEPGSLPLLAGTFCLLLLARLALWAIPVKRLIAHKQRAVAPVGVATDTARVRWAVLVVARYSPVRFVCFPQCLAAAELLHRRGIPSRLHYGVKRAGAKLVTHTWLEADGKILIGGEVAGDFSTLAIY